MTTTTLGTAPSWRLIHDGTTVLSGQIDAAGDDQSALKAIDVTQGWPE